VTFDDARASRAALLLRELSSDFQVIYLACTNRYDGLADAIVELPGPSEVEAAAAGPIAARASALAGKGASAHLAPAVAIPVSPTDPASRNSRGLASSLLEEAQASVDEASADEASADEASADEAAGRVQAVENLAPVRHDGVEAETADVLDGDPVARVEAPSPATLDSTSPLDPDEESGRTEAKDGR
jgi:hypothetical protein